MNNNTALVNNLNTSTPTSASEPSKKWDVLREYILWIFSIVLSVVVLASAPLIIMLTGGQVSLLESIFFNSELLFIGVAASVSVLLECDYKKNFDLVMSGFYIIFIILGAFVYCGYAANEYNLTIEAMTVARSVEEAKVYYDTISAGGNWCYRYLIVIFILGSIKYIQKIVKA